MSYYSVDWYIENEIIYVHYTDGLTIEGLRESIMATQALIESSPRPLVHIINDVGDVTDPISPKDSLDVIRDVGTHPRAGWTIILRESSFLLKLGIAFGTSVFKMRNRTFNTMEETEAFLKEMDDTLSWDKVNKSVIKA